jgi:hypothetical protein
LKVIILRFFSLLLQYGAIVAHLHSEVSPAHRDVPCSVCVCVMAWDAEVFGLLL